jgi:hypothetical protein
MLMCGHLHIFFWCPAGEHSQTKEVLTKPSFQCAALYLYTFIVGKGVEVSTAHVMFGHVGLHLLMP